MADPKSNPPDSRDRHVIAMIVLIFSFVTLFVLAILVIISNWTSPPAGTTPNEVPQRIFNLVLPVFGTWVGTLLAFYFSKDNFEAATRSVNEMAKTMTASDRLKNVFVKDKMIPRSQILTLPQDLAAKLENNSLTLKEITDFLDAQKRYRLPIFDKNGAAKYIIHKSMIDEFVRKHVNAASGPPAAPAPAAGAPPAAPAAPVAPAVPAANIATLKFGDLLSDAGYAKLFQSTWDTVPLAGTLADAKEKLDQIPGCDDIFVTQSGAKTEPVLGWITNDILVENLKV